MNSTLEGRLNKVQAAARAGLARLVADRESRIISRLVAAYRGGTLKNEDLWGGIASISELRHMSAESDHDYMQAESALSNHTAGADHGNES